MFSSTLSAIQTDPLSAYALAAALILALASLGTGWARLDFLPLLRPKGTLTLLGAVLIALLLAALEASLTSSAAQVFPALYGLSRLPLYLLALAYGPSAGALAAALFAGLVTGWGAPGWVEAALVLELSVVGWLAIMPSPFVRRWAGPFNVALGFVVVWVSAGVVLLEQLGYSGALPASHWQFHRHALPGVGVSLLLVAFVEPALYQDLFSDSRIAPPRPAGDPQQLAVEQRATLLRERAKPALVEQTTLARVVAGDLAGEPEAVDLEAVDLEAVKPSRPPRNLPVPQALLKRERPKTRQLEPLELPPLNPPV